MKKNILKGEEHQELLRDIIFFMLETGARREAINNGYADFNYNFTNILAKYYNANDSCRISVESLNLLNEAKKPVKYYLDYTEDDLKKYVVADKDDNLYLGVAGLKKGSRYIKFRITRPGYKSKFNIRMDAGKIKEVKKSRFKQAVNAFGMDVDLDKLYRR